MLISPLPFPQQLPDGYACTEDEPHYDPAQHLSLEQPKRIWSLEEFGYDQTAIASCASPIALTSPFRILSNEGVGALHRIVSRLKAQRSTLGDDRTASYLAGGVYRSKFLRDFCACPIVLEHLYGISGVQLAPHSMPSQQLYVNYAPDDIHKAVDNWHFDGIGFDYVLMISDPSRLKGGKFEYFKGTKYEVAQMSSVETHHVSYGITESLPTDRVIQAEFPGAGYAVFQQGNMIVHRATRLEVPGERITMVPGFVARDASFPDPTAKHDMPYYAEPGIVWELARHSAWLAQSRLQNLIDTLSLKGSHEEIEDALVNAVSDVNAAIVCIKHARTGGNRREAPAST